jgi:hypothetical protein
MTELNLEHEMAKDNIVKCNVNSGFILRCLLSPIVFLWGAFMVCAGMLFPIPLIVIFSFIGFIIHPFVWLLNKSGSDIEGIDDLINVTPYVMINHLLGITLPLWGAFAVAVHYVNTGEFWTGGE